MRVDDAACWKHVSAGFWGRGLPQQYIFALCKRMEIFVNDGTSAPTLSVVVPATASVAQLKAKIFAARRNIHVEHQRLSFGDQVLEDGRCLVDYHISHESSVVLRCGPKFPFTWRPPFISPAEDLKQPADTSVQRGTSVSTVLGGSQTVNETPFAPIRLFVSNAQVSKSPVIICI